MLSLALFVVVVVVVVVAGGVARQVCQDIVRASSRTSSGGDAYAVMAALLSRPAEGDLLTPSGSESAPIGIIVDASDGEVVITVENRCVCHACSSVCVCVCVWMCVVSVR